MAGDLNPLAGTVMGAANPGGYGTALGQLFRRDFPTYGVGVQLTLPVRNRVAQADAVRDELQVRQTQVRRQQLQDQVRLEVADAEESLRQARAAYEAAVEARSEEHTSELQSPDHLGCRLLLEKKNRTLTAMHLSHPNRGP